MKSSKRKKLEFTLQQIENSLEYYNRLDLPMSKSYKDLQKAKSNIERKLNLKGA